MAVYDDIAEFGRFSTEVTAVFIILVCVLVIVAGISLILKKTHLTNKIQGTVQNVPACKLVPNSDNKYNCDDVDVSYTVGGKVYNNTLGTELSQAYTEGADITIYYDKTNPNNAGYVSDNTHVIGGFVLAAGIFGILVAITAVYLSRRYKFLAFVEGGSTGISVARGIMGI